MSEASPRLTGPQEWGALKGRQEPSSERPFRAHYFFRDRIRGSRFALTPGYFLAPSGRCRTAGETPAPHAPGHRIIVMAKRKEGEGRFYALIEKLFKEIDQEAIRADVVALQKAKPNLSREQIASRMTKKAAVRAASVGAAAGVPGGALGVLAMAPDIFNLVLQQSRLVLSIAFLYGQKPHLKDRFREVLATLAVATGASAGRQGMRLLIAKGLDKAAAAQVARKIFGRFLARRIPSIAPVLGTVAGGTINYLSMRAVGRTAVAFYSEKQAASRKTKVNARRKAASSRVASSGRASRSIDCRHHGPSVILRRRRGGAGLPGCR